MEAYHSDLIQSLPLIHQGKVRDSFALDKQTMLIVASDRLSAFDVVLPDPIPGKGIVLTQLSNFWLDYFSDLIPNHLTGRPISHAIDDPQLASRLEPRSCIVKRLQPLPLEAIVRGYIIGSGWKDYQASGRICGIVLPSDLRQAEKLPEPIFTPSNKAAVGEHDENVSIGEIKQLIGHDLTQQITEVSLRLYRQAADYAAQRGIILADTKFEFGLDPEGRLTLMDEVLTPDSSRFWPQSEYQIGSSPPSFDKQYVRDYLETLDWDKTPPGPRLPKQVIRATSAKYQQAYRMLTGTDLIPTGSDEE